MSMETMHTRKLGSLDVGLVGLGTASSFQFTSPDVMPVREKVIETCLSYGVAFIDTSPMYHESEKVVGMATDGRRECFQFATKVWCHGQATGQAQIARSFELLRTEHIEVFQIHNLLDWSTHLPVLEGLKAEGKIDVIGVTHYATSSYGEMMSIMKSGRIDAVQIPYNVLERTCESSLMPLAAELGLGVIVMQPLGVGNLVKDLKREPDLSPLKEHGIETWAQALLAWVLADERVSIVIPATSRPDRVGENAAVGKLPPLPVEMREYISKEAKRCI